MPAFPVPAALKLFSGGVLFGGFWSPPEDYVAPHLVWGARFGLVLTGSPFEVEATFLGGQSTLRGSDVALSSGITRADLLFKLFQSPRVHVVAGPGLGWRYVQLDDDAVAAATADDDFGIGTNPIADLVLTAGGGVRAWIAGPLHIRADVNGAVQLGDQPETSPPHAWPALLATVALDLRWEPPPDRDRDGVPDRDDRCPDSLEDLDYYEDADGCLDPDDDKDRIPDVDDRCKDQPEDLDGFQDQDGCADHNNDGDALPDVYDRCPDQRETQNGWVDGDGCADALPSDVSPLVGTRQDIQFTGTELSPESVPLVEALAAALVAHPDARLHISVFTDSEGGLVVARERSRGQALTLHKALVARGVTANRLEMFAGGDGVPIGADRSDADKPTNRRLVLTFQDPVDGEGRRLEFSTKLPEEW
jgi:outer membrane protein OmpA-like peptidoglycan-associated protein